MTGFSVLRDNGTVLATETASFDALGRTASLVNGLGTFDYTYHPGNLSARVDSIAGPNGLLTALSYFPLNATGGRALRLQGIAHSRAGAALSAFGYDYDPSGRITSWSRQAGAAAATPYSFAYTRSSELLDAVLKDNLGAVSQSYSYRYDAAGNRHLSGEGGAAPELRQHNALNALTQIGGAGKTSVEGTVDEPSTVKVNGQLTTIVALPGTSLWKYERQIDVSAGANTVNIEATDASGNTRSNAYQFQVGPVQAQLQYDDNGNLLDDGAGRTFTWDAKDRLTSVTVGVSTYRWDYDALDRRVSEKVNGVTTARWLYAGPRIVQQRDAANHVVANYFTNGEQRIGGGDAGSYFYTTDHLGSVREMVDGAGAIRARYDYDPYGVMSKVSGDLEAFAGFTGHRSHAPSGLHLALHRGYDARLGRWLSRDPIGEGGGLNLYGYIGQNPTREIDQLGLSPASDAWWRKFWEGLKNTVTDKELWKEKLIDAAARRPGRCVLNSKHHRNSRSPAPNNWEDLFKKSVPDKNGVRWVKDKDGIFHRFSKESNGECHWNGSTGGNDPIKLQDIPNDIKTLF